MITVSGNTQCSYALLTSDTNMSDDVRLDETVAALVMCVCHEEILVGAVCFFQFLLSGKCFYNHKKTDIIQMVLKLNNVEPCKDEIID